MNTPLALAFLFFVGATLGWCLEFLYRNLISRRGPRGKYFINPGFCKGMWLPIYGIGLVAMCSIAILCTQGRQDIPPVWVILAMSVTMNVIEFIGGFILLKCFNIRLWDYRDRPGNIMGITCPLFALIWTGIAAVYYLFLHHVAIGWLEWLSRNLAFSFSVGLFWGIFAIDFTTSMQTAISIKAYGDMHDVIIKMEELKEALQKQRLDNREKLRFFNQIVLNEGNSAKAVIESHISTAEDKITAFRSHRGKKSSK